jgi:hypothetical protein
MSETIVARRGRPLAVPATATAALVAAAALIAEGDPYRPGFFPKCIFLQATGHWCPGCGGLRATYSLLHGDLAGAMSMNPLVPLLVLPVTLFGFGWLWLGAAGVRLPSFDVPRWTAYAVLGVIAAFWVLRNIPALEPYLAP